MVDHLLDSESGDRSFVAHNLKCLTDMNNQNQTAVQTAKRTLVIFRDCHKSNNLVIPIEDKHMERFYRNFARRMGWPCTIRKATVQPAAQPAETAVHNWRKPAAIAQRPRTRLGGAFNLALTQITTEGGEL